MACCLSDKYNGWCSALESRPAHDGNEYCIFHTPENEKWLSPVDFNQFFYDYIRPKIANNEPCSLHGSIFPSYASFIHFDENAPFAGADFRFCTFGEACFCGSVFNEGADFSGATFNGVANFDYAIFRKSSFFCETQFNNVARLKGSTFHGSALFQGARFNNFSILEKTNFLGKASFEHAFFKRPSSFTNSEFHGKANFTGSYYKDLNIFDHTTFHDEANFYSSYFKGKSVFANSTFKNTGTFSLCTFNEYAIFSNSYFYDNMIFQRAKFSKGFEFNKITSHGDVLFDEAELSGFCVISKPTLQIDNKVSKIAFDNTLIDSNITLTEANLFKFTTTDIDIDKFTFEACKFPKDKHGNFKVSDEPEEPSPAQDVVFEGIYRHLKKSAKNNSDERMTSAWHYKEKEYQLRIMTYECHNIFNKIYDKDKKLAGSLSFKNISTYNISVIFETFVLYLYKFISGFGENPMRAGALLLSLLLLPFLFPNIGVNAGPWKSWLYYIPLAKVNLQNEHLAGIDAFQIFLQAFMYIAITLQAAIFGFSLRNKLRR
jgi:uncharacterized protein YjbI with pentapeptide repeats